MNRFKHLLTFINQRLKLPQPTKSRILLEIAADLQDLFQFYLQKGYDETTAAKMAEEKINLTDETLNELIQVHQSFFRRLMDRLPAKMLTKWERAVFVIMLLFLAAMSKTIVFSSDFLIQASRLVWPVLILFSITMIYSIPQFYNLFIKRNHVVKKLRKQANIILTLGILNLFFGIMCYLTEIFNAGSRVVLFVHHLMHIIYVTPENSDQTLIEITSWMMKSSSLVMVTLIVTIFTAIIWYTLMNKILKIEQAEALVLLESRS